MPRSLLRHDIELMLVVLFWAFNVTVVKRCLGDMGPLAFNILRFGMAAVVLMALTLWWDGAPRVSRADAWRLLLLGFLGHAAYQLCFVLGLARTTATATALIFGSTPVVVGVLSRLAGHERIGWAGAGGALLAFAGVALIVRGAPAGQAASSHGSWTGNLLVMAAVLFWSAYTVLSSDLLRRHSPLRVTALSLTAGTAMMLPVSIGPLMSQDWSAVPPIAWAGLIYSFIFALVVSYILWYRSVRAVGNLRTALYSNLVPVFGALFGVWLLDERLSAGVGMGGALVLGGIVLSRWSDAIRRRRRGVRLDAPEAVEAGEA
ncbi:MAG: DMT family transporter [Candidatus Polarisedimenticolia bacterium]